MKAFEVMSTLSRRACAGAAACVLLAVLGAPPAQAHHSFAMFDTMKLWKWEGAITQFDWGNPHMHIEMIVYENSPEAAAAGVDVRGRWNFEGESVTQSARQGWNKATLTAGDKVTIIGYPVRGEVKGGAGLVMVNAAGKVMFFANNHSITPETPLKWK